ncbi:sensor histidine kinase [Arenicella chitinivorans]|uniref:sensor histidine kinase n=1 Tax=Arenicella chitinivorans TaxID=1329800 RepID=UPI00167866F9|nr:histidine kinase [Arenicella chitinivorans]
MSNTVVPDLLRNSTLLVIVVATQVVVLIVWLLFDKEMSFDSLGIWSLYAQWLSVSCAGLLYFFRHRINRAPPWLAVLSVVALICLVATCIDIIATYILYGDALWTFQWRRWLRVALAAALIGLLIVRLLMLITVLDRRSKAEAESRILALQARIQPHFLFNSLNTISELTSINPGHAEKAIGSLSMLFRAGLENQRKSHTLQQEITLTKRYLELETWRLEKRLSVEWHLAVSVPSQWDVPKLILQPLLENAIVHGMQPDGRVEVQIDIRETARCLSFKVENAIAKVPGDKTGHGIAIANIRERLEVLYDDQKLFKVNSSGGKYIVMMQIPKRTAAAQMV